MIDITNQLEEEYAIFDMDFKFELAQDFIFLALSNSIDSEIKSKLLFREFYKLKGYCYLSNSVWAKNNDEILGALNAYKSGDDELSSALANGLCLASVADAFAFILIDAHNEGDTENEKLVIASLLQMINSQHENRPDDSLTEWMLKTLPEVIERLESRDYDWDEVVAVNHIEYIWRITSPQDFE